MNRRSLPIRPPIRLHLLHLLTERPMLSLILLILLPTLLMGVATLALTEMAMDLRKARRKRLQAHLKSTPTLLRPKGWSWMLTRWKRSGRSPRN